jgi:large subunit ribosomal protein L15
MQLHELKRATPQKTEKRIGRGGKRGKMSGRGHKGQTARAGNSTRPEMRDIIKKYPKLRGHGKNRADTVNNEKVKPTVVNLGVLEATFEKGMVITSAALVAANVISQIRKKNPKVKILATGEITKAFVIEGCEVSEAAKVKIVAAGGSVK